MNPKIGRFLNDRVLLFALYTIYAIGVIGHAVDITFPYMLTLTPYVLLLFGGIVLIRTTGTETRLLLWCLVTYIFTSAVEIVGVHSGMPFGEYHYGSTLGLKILGVPLVIGLYWVIIVLGEMTIARKLCVRIVRGHTLFCAFLAGLLTAIFDIPLEIVAINLGYWQWEASVAPLQNYVAWFFVAFLITLAYCKVKIQIKGTLIVHYYVIQFLFLLCLDILIFTGLI